MNKAIATAATQTNIIIPENANKDSRYRLGKFSRWLGTNGTAWHKVDLASYRDHLLAEGKAGATVSAHLATIRARYRAIIRDRDLFYAIVARQTDDPVLRKTLVDEMVTRLENAIDPAAAAVEVEVKQDRPDSEQTRLTSEQASSLMEAPGVTTTTGLRDTAVIALLLCTGVREAELSALEVRDLRQRKDDGLALHVRRGKGCKTRLVPYGALDYVLAIVDKWLDVAGITEGPVFRGLYKGGRKLRPGRLSVRAIEYIARRYPIMVDGRMITVAPHDLRRTYARRLYEAGVVPVAIQQNLGHSDLKTTLGYIGELDAAARRPPKVYDFDLSSLAGVPVQGAFDRAEADT